MNNKNKFDELFNKTVDTLQESGTTKSNESEEDKEDTKEKETGPGGHVRDGTGPHGSGDGPGDGKADCSKVDECEDTENIDENEDLEESHATGKKVIITATNKDLHGPNKKDSTFPFESGEEVMVGKSLGYQGDIEEYEIVSLDGKKKASLTSDMFEIAE